MTISTKTGDGVSSMVEETLTDKKTDETKKAKEGSPASSTAASVLQNIVNFVPATVHLFCQRRFGLHRLMGMVYIVQFVLAVLGEFFPGILVALPHLHVTMPLTGCLQAVIATCTFKFLGKNPAVQGYFSDKRTMSYDFVFENVFFAGLLAFQALYFYQTWLFRACPALEALLVFFPYFTIRKFFPRTRLRDSINSESEKSTTNRKFIRAQTYTTKVFMMFGKHVSGLLCNYLIFLNAIPQHHQRTLRLQFIMGGWGTTIAMFLHTMKFKGYLGPRTALVAYTSIFPCFYLVYVALYDVLFQQLSVTALALGGLAVNFLPVPVQVVYQVGAYAYLRYLRESTTFLGDGAGIMDAFAMPNGSGP